MKSGSARVFEHQVPGGQYSNLLVQCRSMGLYDKWEEVLDAYRDVNKLFGDIVKVTPSSKCVGDLALYLVTRSLTTSDLLDPSKVGDSTAHPFLSVHMIIRTHPCAKMSLTDITILILLITVTIHLTSYDATMTGGLHRLPRERGRAASRGLRLPSPRVPRARRGGHTQGLGTADGTLPHPPSTLPSSLSHMIQHDSVHSIITISQT